MPGIKAITIAEPWASLLVFAPQIKRYHIQSWAINYDGAIAIHASKKEIDYKLVAAIEIAVQSQIPDLYGLIMPSIEVDLMERRRGRVLAVAQGAVSTQIDPDFMAAQTELERLAGDWSNGLCAIEFINLQLINPVPAPDQQMLWNFEQWDGRQIEIAPHHVVQQPLLVWPRENTAQGDRANPQK